MRYLLLQNQNIVPGTRWVIRIPDEGQYPYTAQIREFETELEARAFLQDTEGLLVPGKPWALIFAGVADNTRCPISTNHFEETEEFLRQAADWLQLRG